MFRALFAAIRNATSALEEMAASIREANTNFRANVLGEGEAPVPEISHQPSVVDGNGQPARGRTSGTRAAK
jgi:hypothetical protein